MIASQLTEITKAINEEKVFSLLSPVTKEALAKCAVIAKFKQNQYLWHYGDSCDYCTLILSGLVEINRPTGSEEDTCMGVFSRNDVVGLSALLRKIAFPASARVLTEARVMKLYLAPLLHHEKEGVVKQEVANWVRDRMLSHEHILREKIDILTAGNTEDRLRELFRHLLRRFGSIKTGCRYEINIKLSKSKAAKLMGIRSETAIRLINDWQKLKLIDWNEDKITIHDLEMIDRYIMQHKAE